MGNSEAKLVGHKRQYSIQHIPVNLERNQRQAWEGFWDAPV